MRQQRVHHEAQLLKLAYGPSAFSTHPSLPKRMAPRTHYAKSQEIVYKSMGTAARPRFKAINAKLPTKKKPSSSQALTSEPVEPPIVEPPHEGGGHFGGNDDPGYLDFEIPHKQKKVSYLLVNDLQLNGPIEAI